MPGKLLIRLQKKIELTLLWNNEHLAFLNLKNSALLLIPHKKKTKKPSAA